MDGSPALDLRNNSAKGATSAMNPVVCALLHCRQHQRRPPRQSRKSLRKAHVTSLPGEASDLGKTCPQQGDLTIEEREDLLALLIAVRNELHDRGEDALVELVYQLMDRLLDDDTSEIADDARATIPRLHNLWCGTARRFDLTNDDSDEEGDSDEGDGFAALVHGTLERYATKCISRPWRRPSSRREGLRPVC